MSEVVVVVGGQYGSEAKGHVTAQIIQREILAQDNQSIINIRVAGPNAGHTVYDAAGNKFAFRQLPVGMVLGALPIIAAGSEIDPEVLLAELELAEKHGHFANLILDENATLIEDHHKELEAGVDLVGKVGSTGKGIGAARAARVMRAAKRVKDDPEFVQKLRERFEVTVTDTVDQLAYWASLQGVFLIVEGTQGYGLGVHQDCYPQTTSSDARAIDFLAMAGISPWQHGIEETTVVIAARVYPIRVHGNSGPMKDETSWEELGLPEERTTVTQKVRRVGHWDAELIRAAVRDNGGLNQTAAKAPTVVVALTMIDQLIPELKDFEICDPDSECPGHPGINESTNNRLNGFLRQVIDDAGAPIVMFTTGPRTAVWL